MLTFLNAKVRSGIHRTQTKIYKSSGAWARNPLNPKNFAEAPTACDWPQIDDELSAWAAAAKIPLHNFDIDAADYQAFKSRVAVRAPMRSATRTRKFSSITSPSNSWGWIRATPT